MTSASISWTSIPPLPAGAREIYVDATNGLDTNDGLTSSAPYKTLLKAMEQLVDGVGSHVFLKCGETWTDEHFGWVSGSSRFKGGGNGASEPIVITSYGTGARPIILFPTTGSGQAVLVEDGGSTPADVSHVWWIGLEMAQNHGGTPTDSGECFRMLNRTFDGWLVEDCVLRDSAKGVNFGNTTSADSFTMRGCQVYGMNNGLGHTSGVFGDDAGMTNHLYEFNFFHDNGNTSDGSHNFYYGGNVPNSTIFRYNVTVTPNGSDGAKLRNGGTFLNNVAIDCGIGFNIGDATYVSGGVEFDETYNVTLGHNNGVGTTYNWAYMVDNVKTPTTLGNQFKWNLALNSTRDSNSRPLHVTLNSGGQGAHDIDFGPFISWEYNGTILFNSPQGSAAGQIDGLNVHDWHVHRTATGNAVVDVNSAGNTGFDAFDDSYFTGAGSTGASSFDHNGTLSNLATFETSIGGSNLSTTGEPTYTDPDDEIGDYSTAVGGLGTKADFITQCKAQRSPLGGGTWDADYAGSTVADYFLINFGFKSSEQADGAQFDASGMTGDGAAYYY